MKKAFSVFMLIILTSCMPAGTPKLYLNTGNMSMEVKTTAPTIGAVAFSPDGKSVLSGGVDHRVRLWDVITGKEVRTFDGHTSYILAVAFSTDGKYALSGSFDGTVRLWDIATGKETRQFPDYALPPGRSKSIQTISYSPDGKYIAFLSGRYINLHEAATGKLLKKYDLYDSTGRPSRIKLSWALITFSPDSKYMLCSEGTGNLRLLDISTGEVVKEFEDESDDIRSWSSAAFSPDGKYMVSASSTFNRKASLGDHAITFWEVSTGKQLKQITYYTGYGLAVPFCIAYSSDGKHVLLGYSDFPALFKPGERVMKLWNAATGEQIREFTRIPSSGWLLVTTSVAFSPDSKFAINASEATIRLWDAVTGKEAATMISFEDGEWLAITPDGYYNSSEKGAQYLSLKVNDKDYSVDQFYDVFYRPDIVAAKLRGEDISGLVTITMQDAIKSPPPVVEFTSKISDTYQPKVKVCYKANSTGGGIGEVRLFHNGKLIQSDGYYREMAKATSDKTPLASLSSKAIYDDMRSIAVKGKIDSTLIPVKSKGEVFEDCREVEAVPGENEVSVTAFNSSNTVQSYMKTTSFSSKLKAEDPHLYILAIGIDRYKDSHVNLKYAVKDARDMEEKIKVQAATLYNPRNIHYELLTDRESTKANITSKINELTGKIKPQDSFILFVAGHGVLLQNQYYLLTHDYDGSISENSVISSNEIVEMSKKIKSLSQLLIFDTCHAGGVDTIISGLYDARMSVLAKKMGLHIYASASDKQAAMDGYKGNGLFTYTLLDGLNNNRQADRNKDGKVSIVGLGEYSRKMTTNISKQIGHEQTPLIINFGKDYPIYQLR